MKSLSMRFITVSIAIFVIANVIFLCTLNDFSQLKSVLSPLGIVKVSRGFKILMTQFFLSYFAMHPRTWNQKKIDKGKISLVNGE